MFTTQFEQKVIASDILYLTFIEDNDILDQILDQSQCFSFVVWRIKDNIM